MAKLEIVKDSEGNKIVLIPEILFFNKQNIEWELVEQYLEKYVGEIVEIAETREVVYIGKKFPDEYSGSLYTRKSKGTRCHVYRITPFSYFCKEIPYLKNN